MAQFSVTTAIPYVNAKPHIGHALEYVQADVVARYHKLIGDDVHLISGADENALKNVQAAEKAGMDVQEFLDQNSSVFRKFYKDLGVELDEFRRGTDQKRHWPGVQELWKRCMESGDIYKKTYRGLYCVGCEQFYLSKDLVNGKCPMHLKEPERVEEENYFFRLSTYQKKLEELLTTGTEHLGQKIILNIIPEHRKNEVFSFVKQGLEDFSISRSTMRARGVGVPIPGDDSQQMYVWFDALTIYMTAVGYGYDETLWKKWWPADLHIIGKDIIRFHCVYWPAVLLSAGLPMPKTVFSHGFITSGGQKMSKTLGNVIDPYEFIEKFGVDALRYYLLREIPPFDDGDLTVKRFEEVYESDLANGLGNLVQRVAKMCEMNGTDISTVHAQSESVTGGRAVGGFDGYILQFEFNLALEELWREMTALDVIINEKKIWKLDKIQASPFLKDCVNRILSIAKRLEIFLPSTSVKILEIFKGPTVTAPETPLFPRLKK